jgi:succinate dehydrogenase / fumarate reductase cytochrome b subunit
VALGACPELYVSTQKVAEVLGIQLEELTKASCTGSGVIQERNPELGDALNARTLAMAEQLGLPVMTICSVCTGVMNQANTQFSRHPDYLERINQVLEPEHLGYGGTVDIKHLLWILLEDYGLDRVRSFVRRPLKGIRIAPFYGCYILRPSAVLGYQAHPRRSNYLEEVIHAVGAEPVDYFGKSKCCGFPIVTMNLKNSLTMAGNHVLEAKTKGADCMVTPCPLCHLNLDAYQPEAAKIQGKRLDLPVLHLPELLGLAFGLLPQELRLNRHVVSTDPLLSRL